MILAAAPSVAVAPQCAERDETVWEFLFRSQALTARDDRQWRVFYTKSRQEKALASHLRARHVPHYLPLYKKQTLTRGRRFTSMMPLFSGYLFAYADVEERIVALESNRIARTIDVAGGQEAQLTHDLIQIQRLIDADLPLTIESRIQPGQHVRVKCGNLAGLEGTVTSRRGGSRLLIAVNYLQQGASVEIEDFAVELI